MAPAIVVGWGATASATRLDAFVANLFRHCDAYLVSGVDGKFGVRLVRGPAGDEPTLDESSLTEEPSIEVDRWAETFNQTVVKFTDRAKNLIEDSVTWIDRANFAIVGATKSQTLEMPWLTRRQLAWKIAAAHGKRNALPRLRGSRVARASVTQSLAPGSLFNLSFAASGLVNVLCRVESRTISDETFMNLQYLGTLESVSSLHAVTPPLTLWRYLNPCCRRKFNAFSERTPASRDQLVE